MRWIVLGRSKATVVYSVSGRPSNPFARPVDRFAATLKSVIVALAGVAIVLAAVIGTWEYHQESARAAQQRATTTLVEAVTSTDAPITMSPRGSVRTTPMVKATWAWGSESRTDSIEVPSGTPAGTEKHIAVNEDGSWAGPRITTSDVVSAGVAAVLITLAASALLLGAVWAMCSRAVERRRQQYWDESIRRLFATYSR
ncbi:Rv1733c family protein [Rhodococcus wratislaviensis]|uniref:Rv1733c family protein n=1 Tax=Rhodococcus wratislaviensis TaxID=44752 RepID=UPI0026885A11